jgi:hypothetical protein
MGEKGDLLPRLMGFRVVAPGALQGTTLEEENRSYSRPVMKAETLNIKDEGVFLNGFPGLLGQSLVHLRSSCVPGREDIHRTGSTDPANGLLREKSNRCHSWLRLIQVRPVCLSTWNLSTKSIPQKAFHLGYLALINSN